MINQDILKLCFQKGILLDKEVLEMISEIDDKEVVKELLDKINITCNEKIISKSFFYKNIDKLQSVVLNTENEKKIVLEKLFVNLGINLEIGRETKEIEITRNIEVFPERQGKVRVLSSSILPTRKIEVEHFVRHFKNRFNVMKRLLQERWDLQNLISINKLSGHKQGCMIGMIADKRVTKNKNVVLDMEDLTGRVRLLVNKNNAEVFEKAKEIMLDDIIAIKGAGDREMFFVNEIYYPDSALPEKHRLDKEEYVAFISDVHVGSRMFLEKNFLKFVNWINGEIGNEKQKEMAKKVKYVFMVGDTVDGVGIFPGQEEFLVIKDVAEQYKELARFLGMIRRDVTIVMCPGQHDAVRVAEPQPPVDERYARALLDLSNVICVSNPAMIEILNGEKRGFKILMYHGASFHGFINEIEDLRINRGHDNPARVVRHVLKRRHLAPSHSDVIYIPSENEDPLLIKDIPDLILTGDLHRPEVDLYNNILIVCSSCWQSITPFEEKMGNKPDPCKVPVLNLKTRAIKILDFS